jgi:putative ABC transport system permease protein
LIGRMRGLPGVQSVAAARVPLIANSNSSTTMGIEGYTPQPGERMSIKFNEISPGYFRTVGMPLRAGRDFTDGDVLGTPGVAIVNEAFAKQYKLGPNPVGRRLRRGGKDSDPFDIEVVGLVADAAYSRVRDPEGPVFFLPYRQNARLGAISFYALTGDDPSRLLAAIRPLVQSMDAALPVQRLYTMPDQIAQNLSSDRLMSVLSAAFAGLATALAAIGLYGVLAYTVSQRTREFGVRMALGAEPGAVQRLVLRQVAWMTLIGGVIGVGLAVGAGKWTASLLFQMSSADPTVLVLSVLTLAAVAFGAGYVPSRRASRVDPMKALRWE